MLTVGIVLTGAFIALLGVGLVYTLYAFARDAGIWMTKADREKKTRIEEAAKKRYALIVGREYFLKWESDDRPKDYEWITAIYLGMDIDNWYTFKDIASGNGMKFRRSDPRDLFKDGYVKQIQVQSVIPDRINAYTGKKI